MPTDPLTASRYPSLSSAVNVPQDIQNAVYDLADNTITRATSTSDRTTRYANWVAAGGVMTQGLYCHVTGVGLTYYDGAAWTVVHARALLQGGGVQSIPNNVFTVVNVNSEQWASGLTTTGASGRINAASVGTYIFSGVVTFSANATGRRQVGLLKNGTVQTPTQNRSDPDATNSLPLTTASYPMQLAAGDYVQLGAFQDSGGALNVDRDGSFLQGHRIGQF